MAIDFAVIKDNKTIFGFHDSPDDFWVDISEIDFIQKLAAEKIIRYRILPIKSPAKHRLWTWLTKLFQN